MAGRAMTLAEQPAGDDWVEHRNLLFSVAYRILGSAADAEDVVQDAWLKWSAVDRSRVVDRRAYLLRVVSTVAIDRLRTARAQRETYIGPWLPEPILTTTDAGEDVGVAESVSMALLVVLETLTPLERAVFVLSDVFGFSYAEIADAVRRSEASVRQAALRARRHVRARRPRVRADRGLHQRVTERFLAAATGGDVSALMQLLAPEVALWTDGGGKVPHARRVVTGVARVAAWFAGISSQQYQGIEFTEMGIEQVELNGAPAVMFTAADRVIATLSFDLDEQGLIAAIHNVANPDKLRAVAVRTVYGMTPVR